MQNDDTPDKATLTGLVWESPNLGPKEKLILLALLQEKLSVCGYCRQTIWRTLRDLRQRGILIGQSLNPDQL